MMMTWMNNLFGIFSKKRRELTRLKEAFLLGNMSSKEYKEKVYILCPDTWSMIASPTDKELLDLNQKFNRNLISKEEYKNKLKTLDEELWEKLIDDEDEKIEYELEKKLKTGKISQEEYKKEILTLHKKPYIAILNIKYDEENGRYEFEFDWNDFFIEELRENDFNGTTENELIDDWYLAFSTMVASESDKVILTDPEDMRKVNKKKSKTEHF